jgi:thiamine pyridinylase
MKRLPLIMVVILTLLPAAVRAQSPRQLTVMLYPYIPDINNDSFAALIQYVEQGFEAQNPDIDLTIIMNQQDDTYDLDTLQQLFTDLNGPQVVELDLMMLSNLVQSGWVIPVSYGMQDAFPVAQEAVQYGSQVWGIPTRVCSLFLFGFSPEIATATGSDDLVAILNSLDPDNQVRNVAGGFFGQNTLAIYYADSYIGNNGFASIPNAFYIPPSLSVVSDMSRLFAECTFQNQNPCLNEIYQNPTAPALQFAEGLALSTIGFSESLYTIETNNSGGKTVYISPAPLGGSISPMIYSDALTFNAQNCDGQCQQDAYTFADYYLSSDVQLWITMGEDGSSGVPRYVLPAQRSFYDLPQIASNPYFDEFLPAVTNGAPFPTDGYTDARDPLYKAVCQYLDDMMSGDPCQAKSA